MITKAIIKETNKIGSNKFKVYIPLLRNANDEEADAIFDATLCYTSGILYTLNVDDVVFVAFEDNLVEKPIILGKLFQGENKDNANAHLNIKTLNVTDKCILPNNTLIANKNMNSIINEVKKEFSLDLKKEN